MDKLLSRKLIVAVVTLIVIALNKKLGLNIDADGIMAMLGLSGAYVASQAAVDFKVEGNK